MPRALNKTLKKKPLKKRGPRRLRVPEKVKILRTNRNILEGYKALDHLWSKGLKPEGLKFHFYLAWFTYANGNGTLMAKMCGIHRNDIFYIFKIESGSTNTLPYRVLWEKIKTKYPKKDFFFRFAKFYGLAVGKISLNLFQHQALANLWLMGIPFKVLRSHYFLWAARQGRELTEIAKMMGKSIRNTTRFREHALRPGSPIHKWLKPLKVKRGEWYFKP